MKRIIFDVALVGGGASPQPGEISRANKISGPLLDRIDIQCEIQPVPFSDISTTKPGEPSSEKVKSMHIAEAIGYSNLERGDWAERGI